MPVLIRGGGWSSDMMLRLDRARLETEGQGARRDPEAAANWMRKAAEAVSKGAPAPGLEAAAQQVRSSSFVLPEQASFRDAALDAAKVRKGRPHVAV